MRHPGNCTQVDRQCFGTMCTHLGTKQMKTSANHPQTNGHTERYNRLIVARLRQYVATQQPDWDLIVQPLTYMYNREVHRSTKTTLYSLVFTWHDPGPTIVNNPSALAADAHHTTVPQALTTQLLARIKSLQAHVKKPTDLEQKRQKLDCDTKARSTPTIEPG